MKFLWWLAQLPPSNEIEKRADEILARPEFQPPSNLIEEILKLIEDFLNWIRRMLGIGDIDLDLPPGEFSWIVYVILGVIIVGLGIAVFFIVRRLMRASAKREKLDELDPDHEALIALTGSAQALKYAREALAREDGAEAVKWIYMAMLWGLHEQGVISLGQEGRTARQYTALVRRAGDPRAPQVKQVADVYNLVRYGARPIDVPTAQSWLTLVEGICQGTGGGQ